MIDANQAAIVMAKFNTAFGAHEPITYLDKQIHEEYKWSQLIWNQWHKHADQIFCITLYYVEPNSGNLSIGLEYYGGRSEGPNQATICVDSNESAKSLLKLFQIEIKKQLKEFRKNKVRHPNLTRQTDRAIAFMEHLSNSLK